MEARRRRSMSEIQTVEEALETEIDGQADDADEEVIASTSAPGVVECDCHSAFLN